MLKRLSAVLLLLAVSLLTTASAQAKSVDYNTIYNDSPVGIGIHYNFQCYPNFPPYYNVIVPQRSISSKPTGCSSFQYVFIGAGYTAHIREHNNANGADADYWVNGNCQYPAGSGGKVQAFHYQWFTLHMELLATNICN